MTIIDQIGLNMQIGKIQGMRPKYCWGIILIPRRGQAHFGQSINTSEVCNFPDLLCKKEGPHTTSISLH